MAKFQHKHAKTVVLMDAKKTEPWAVFQDGVFETDDEKIIARLTAWDEVSRLPDAEPEPATLPAE